MKKKWLILVIIGIIVILVFAINKIYITNYYDKVRPNNITLYGSKEKVIANMGTYSWSKKVFGQTLYVNACGIGPLEMNYKDTVKIVQGEKIKTDLMYSITKIATYKYDENEYKQIKNQIEYDEEKQELNTEEMDLGIYIIELQVEEGNNDARYSFKLEITDLLEVGAMEEEVLNLQTFYAEIKNINDTNLLVDGLDVNDINYRGEFSFKVTENTKLEWRNTIIDMTDFDEGDNISITFKGEIQETYPAQISNVVKIQLLDNEK